MVALTLSDPDVIFIEPSQAKDNNTERAYSYVYAKTFKRNGEKIKYFTSVTVAKEGLEISVSSHFVNPNKMKNKLMEFERAYTKETLLPNSSEMRLTEHQSDVPDLLPTQGNNVSSAGKDTQSSNNEQGSSIKNQETDAIPTDEEVGITQSNSILQGEEVDNSRGDSQSKEQSTEVPTGVRSSNENGTLPQSTPTEVDEPQPIGNSFFGKVYNQFKGKAKEAVNFLMRHRSGKLLGVFHRNDIGEISLVWGDEKGGLAHIISKHIVEQNDFNNIDEVINTMQQVINNGTITRENKDKVVIDYNDYRVAIRKQTRDNNGNVVEQGNWIVTAFDKSRSKKDKTPSEKTLSTPPSNQETDGVTLPSNGVPADKVTQSSQTKQEKENKFSPTPRKDGESITDYAERVAEEHHAKRTLKEEEAKVDTNPTEAQKEDSSKRKTKPFAEYSAYAKETPKAKDKPKDSNRLVSDERMEELKRRLREKLRGQLNMGVDPKLLAIGTEIAVGYIERGVTKFGDYAKAMIADLGDTIRPYLKALYNGARDMPEMVELSKDMTPYNEVSSFNVAAIGKEGKEVNPSILDTAEQISNEATVESNVQQEVKNMVETEDVDNDTYSITKQHNNKKDIDIWVVRGKERTDKDVYMQRKQVAKEHNGYYSSFRGVNGFVFNSPEDAQAFADKVFNTENKGDYAQKSEEIMRTDNQGNPIDKDGKLIIEKVGSISDLTDEDFEHPTRSVELPAIPQNIDEAIGANGKPVVIKKNIFEKNKQSHSDLTPVQSRDILQSALYNADLYGQNQKAKRPYNWIVINTKDKTGNNRLVLLEVNDKKDNVEIVHWHYIREAALETIKRQAEREGGLILILPSDYSEEAGGLSSRTQDLSSVGKDTQSSHTKQEIKEENAITEREGLKIGDKVMYKGKEATIYAIEEDRPLLDTGLAPVMYELGRWEDVIPIKEKPLEAKDKDFKEVDNKNGDTKLSDHIAEKEQESVGVNKKVVSSHAEGSLFDEAPSLTSVY